MRLLNLVLIAVERAGFPKTKRSRVVRAKDRAILIVRVPAPAVTVDLNAVVVEILVSSAILAPSVMAMA